VKGTPLGKGGRADRSENVGNESDEEEDGYGSAFVTNGSIRPYAPALSEEFELGPVNKESSKMLMDCIAALGIWGRIPPAYRRAKLGPKSQSPS
jgi:hypothetical protein